MRRLLAYKLGSSCCHGKVAAVVLQALTERMAQPAAMLASLQSFWGSIPLPFSLLLLVALTEVLTRILRRSLTVRSRAAPVLRASYELETGQDLL